MGFKSFSWSKAQQAAVENPKDASRRDRKNHRDFQNAISRLRRHEKQNGGNPHVTYDGQSKDAKAVADYLKYRNSK